MNFKALRKEIRKYIKDNVNCSQLNNPIYRNTETITSVRIPYFVDYKEVTVDKEKIEKWNLKYYDKATKDAFSTDDKLVAKLFKHAKCMTADGINDLANDSKKRNLIIEDIVEKVLNNLEREYIEFDNKGYSEKTENWVKCGKIRYYIIGFAGGYLDNPPNYGNSMKVIIPRFDKGKKI